MKRNLLPIAAFIILFASSCQQRLYFPERANVMGFKEANEAKLTASFKPQADDDNSGDNVFPNASPAIDLAYSITDHIAVVGSFRSLVNREIDEDGLLYGGSGSYGRYNGHRFEGGIGYFTAPGKGLFEVIGGYGNGSLRRRDVYFTPPISSYDFDTRYHRFFGQAAGGIGNNVFRFMGGVRLAVQKYYDFRAIDPTLVHTIASSDGRTAPATQQLFTFVEPFVNMEVGYKLVKFNMQFGTAAQMSGGKIAAEIPFYGSFGIVIHYAPRFFAK